MSTRPRAGFTAEELIAALGMILLGVLGFMLVTAHVPEAARTIACTSNVRQLGSALRMYMTDNAGRMPPGAMEFDAVYPYSENQVVFECPSERRRERGDGAEERRAFIRREEYRPDYGYVMNPAARADDPAATLLLGDNEPDRHLHRTWLAARVDGAAQRFDAKSWEAQWGEVTVDEAQ